MATIGIKKLKHIPGDPGLPVFGDFFAFIKNATQYYKEKQAKYGDVFYVKNIISGTSLVLCGQAANKFILVENAKLTRNKEAWERLLSDLFPNGLMLMDGDVHKYHRGIMQEAFKKAPMQGYLEIMPTIISKELDKLEGKSKVEFFPFLKRLTLTLAAEVFFGIEIKDDLKKVNQAVTDIVNASAAIPVKIPGSRYWKGLKGRQTLIHYFKSIIQERRDNPGKDLFSKLCAATSEEGDQFTDTEVIDHLIFVLMAAHDTTAITLTLMSYFISKHPEWQDRIREEAQQIDLFADLQVNDLRALTDTGLVMKETLRMHPPLIGVIRKLAEDFEIEGYPVPKGTNVSVVFQMTHLDERTWDAPDQFDPMRFGKERNEQSRCPYAYAPFGAGPHHCIGYGFAEMQVKMVISELIKRFELSVPEGYECEIKDVPLKQPADNLPIYLKSRK